VAIKNNCKLLCFRLFPAVSGYFRVMGRREGVGMNIQHPTSNIQHPTSNLELRIGEEDGAHRTDMTDMKSHTLPSRTRGFRTGVAVAGRPVGPARRWKSSAWARLGSLKTAWARLARGCREKIFARERAGFGGRMILGGLNGRTLAPLQGAEICLDWFRGCRFRLRADATARQAPTRSTPGYLLAHPSGCFDFRLVNETNREVGLPGKPPGFTPPRFNLSMCL
jgi:hypothetical protein